LFFFRALLIFIEETQAQNVTRGPYLQSASQTSIVVRWWTDAETTSQVKYGTDKANLLFETNNLTLTTEHIIEINGLTSDTKYLYTIGITENILLKW